MGDPMDPKGMAERNALKTTAAMDQVGAAVNTLNNWINKGMEKVVGTPELPKEEIDPQERSDKR